MSDKEKVLIADDSEINREILQMILEESYEIVHASDGKQALDYLKENPDVAILLLDMHMPNMSGMEVLERLNAAGTLDKLPVIVISADDSVDTEATSFELGVDDFIHKPFAPRLVQQRVRNAVELYSTRNALAERVEQQTEALRRQNEMLRRQAQKLKETNSKIIEVLGTTVEFRHMDSYEHINRVKAFTGAIARQVVANLPEYGLTEEKAQLIVDASSLHDIGKIAISDNILLKPGRLTKEEYEEMKTHTTKGCEILERVNGIWDQEFGQTAYDICRHHHERYDGKGYPDGLKGDDIPISAQIVSVADVYDALVCKRVYKDAIPKDEAFEMIMKGECGVFSERILKCFALAREELEQIADTIVGTK